MYDSDEAVLVYLISESVNGAPERRLAARFILSCLRVSSTPEEIRDCLDELEDTAILDIGDDARALAATLGLIHQSPQ